MRNQNSMSWSKCVSWMIACCCLWAFSWSGPSRAQDALSATTGRIPAAQWGLNLPDKPVSRRIGLRSEFKGRQVFGEVVGPGCRAYAAKWMEC